jgi:hypothetical protein
MDVLAPDAWLYPKIIYYWQLKQNDIQIAESINDDIQRDPEMAGKYQIR